MKKRLRDVIDLVDYHDLVRMKKDISEGGVHINKLLESKIKEHQKGHEAVCSVCASDIDPSSVNSYTLIFGPDDFKKKATFCGVDCLQYFLEHLKKIKQVKHDD